jgi:hypothetical protein
VDSGTAYADRIRGGNTQLRTQIWAFAPPARTMDAESALRPASDKPAGLSDELWALLRGLPCHVVVQLATERCHDLATFRDWVDQPGEWADLFPLKDDGEHPVDRATVALLKSAWRTACAQVDSKTTQTAQRRTANADSALDDPIDALTAAALIGAHNAHHKITLSSIQLPCDTLLGRVVRERQRRTPTPFPLTRARSLADVNAGGDAPAPSIGGVGCQLVLRTQFCAPKVPRTHMELMRQLRTLYNAYVLAGFHMPETGAHEEGRLQEDNQPPLPWCSRHWAAGYLEQLESQALSGLSVAHIVAADAVIRTRACELIRNNEVSPLTWDEAMTQASQQEATVWLSTGTPHCDPAHLEHYGNRKRAQTPGHADSDEYAEPRRRNKKRKNAPRDPNRHITGVPTAQVHKSGARYCKRWNDGRGCEAGDTCSLKHRCDHLIVDVSGARRVCNQAHTRMECPYKSAPTRAAKKTRPAKGSAAATSNY